jgi:hypothetical protein
MISALEAHKKTSYVLSNTLKDELKEIEESIDIAIKKGKFHTSLYSKFLSSAVKEILEELGYKVVYINDMRNVHDIAILWTLNQK